MKRKFSIFLLFVCLMMFVMLVVNSFAQSLADAKTSSTIDEITQSVDAIGWLLIFLGWLMYWLKKLDEERMEHKVKGIIGSWHSVFISENIFEIPISLIACFVLVILAPSIPTDLIDLNGKISNFLIGFAGSSILNGLITKSKTKL